MNSLLRGELLLTLHIILGLVFAELISRLHVTDFIIKHFIPKNIPPVTGLAVALSAGSSKAGAAVISSSLSHGEISQHTAVWSVIMLSLPSYLRRWPSTFALALSTAGIAGAVYAVSMLVISVLRFMIALHFLRHDNFSESSSPHQLHNPKHSISLTRKLINTLPPAWLFFALAYSLVPHINSFMTQKFSGIDTFIPLSGWTVAASAIGRVSAALSLAGGAIEAGGLSVTQAVFALVLGSGLGTVTRILRMNAGYYYGFFPKDVATKMLLVNFASIIPLVVMNLIFAAFAVSLFP